MHYDNDISIEHLYAISEHFVCVYFFFFITHISNNIVDNVMDKHEATTNPN